MISISSTRAYPWQLEIFVALRISRIESFYPVSVILLFGVEALLNEGGLSFWSDNLAKKLLRSSFHPTSFPS